MDIAGTTVLTGLAKTARVELHGQGADTVAFVQLDRRQLKAGGAGGLGVVDMTMYCALVRHGMWWNHPEFGSVEQQLGDDVQYLLYRRSDGLYGLLLPLVDGDLRAYLCGESDGLRIGVQGAAPDGPPKRATVLAVAVGEDPHELSQRVVNAASAHLGTFRPRQAKPTPAFVEYLGWCTWDAFYREVDEKKVLRGLKGFQRGGVSPKFVIVDDGWQTVRDNMLESMDPDRKKFPEGLGRLICHARQQYGVEVFGVWTTLQGYWDGVHPKGAIDEAYRTVTNKASSPKGEEPTTRTFVHPQDVHRFYHDWYASLAAAGVNMTKVDSQSSLMAFTNGKFGQASAQRDYQWALQGASAVHMEGNLIHCMCNGSDVAYAMQNSTVWRNSDDYFPKAPESHARHVFYNAMNNLWTGTFSLPDWDMFWSQHPEGSFHAAARALSGGPVYVSDEPEKHDFDLLGKLCTSDGRVLRCPNPALPAADCLFTDCLHQPKLLKITNTAGEIGIVGAFHCAVTEPQEDPDAKPQPLEAISDGVRADDVPGLSGTRFAAWLHKAGRLEVVRKRQKIDLKLDHQDWEIVTFSPIRRGAAALGLIEKLNPAASVVSFQQREDAAWEAEIRDGGLMGFYLEDEPLEVHVDGKNCRFDYDPARKVMTVRTRPAGGVIRVVIHTR